MGDQEPVRDDELEPPPYECILTLTADSFLPPLDQPAKQGRTLAQPRTLSRERD